MVITCSNNRSSSSTEPMAMAARKALPLCSRRRPWITKAGSSSAGTTAVFPASASITGSGATGAGIASNEWSAKVGSKRVGTGATGNGLSRLIFSVAGNIGAGPASRFGSRRLSRKYVAKAGASSTWRRLKGAIGWGSGASGGSAGAMTGAATGASASASSGRPMSKSSSMCSPSSSLSCAVSGKMPNGSNEVSKSRE